MEGEPTPKKTLQPGDTDLAKDVDPVRMEMYLQELRDRQNLSLALLAALFAAAVGAAAWAAVTVLTKREYAVLAIGVGFLVGICVRTAGRGIDKVYGAIGGLFALLGVVAGKLAAAVVLISQKTGAPLKQVSKLLDLNLIFTILKQTFSVIDILFYAVAIFVGYKYAIKAIPAADLLKMKKESVG